MMPRREPRSALATAPIACQWSSTNRADRSRLLRHGRQSRSGKRVVIDPETNAGPEIGPVDSLKSRQEHGHAVTETRHGRATLPPRPGQWA
jgi:hypothetical protein